MIPRSPKSKAQKELRSKCPTTGKRAYRSEDAANVALRFAETQRGLGNTDITVIRAYACPDCSYWHVTSRPNRLPMRSAKMSTHYRTERVPFVVEMLEEFPFCQLRFDENCTIVATCVHELRKKSQGGSDTDRANCKTSCAYCNGAVEDHPIEAHERGFVLWAGESA